MFGNLVKKVKSAVPKAVTAVKKTAKKVVGKVKKTVTKTVTAAIPKVIKATKKVTTTARKVAAAVPRAVNNTKKTINKVTKTAQKAGEAVKKKVEKKVIEVSTDLKNRNKRIVEKIKEEWKKTESGLDRGIVTMGARAFGLPTKNDFKKLDFILKSRKVVLEEYPILNWQTNMGKKILKNVKDDIVRTNQARGSYIYNLNIPVISNFAGEFYGVREEGAKSGISSTVGALAKGILVDGLGGTVEGLANLVVDPMGAIEGINTIFAYPDETLPVIWEGVKGAWNDKIVNGSAEDRANITGQAVFEVATWLVGVGEAKAGTSVAKAADKTADIAKVTDKIADIAKVTDKIADASKVLDKATDLARYKTGLKTLGKDIVKGLDDQALAAGKKFGNAVDQMRYSMNQLTRNMQPQFAGIGNLDEMGSTADKIEDWYKAVKKSTKKQDAVGSGIHIRGGVEEQVIGKIDDGIEVVGKVSDDVAKGTGEVAGLKSRKLSSEQIELDWLADEYTAVEVKGTVKVGGKEVDVSRRVYQIEIDKNYVPNNPKALGKSNGELMEKGKSPYIVKDGVESKVELHHLIQKEPGGMVEIAELTHDKYDSTLHGLVQNGRSFRNNPELEKMYNNFRSNYWKMRASK